MLQEGLGARYLWTFMWEYGEIFYIRRGDLSSLLELVHLPHVRRLLPKGDDSLTLARRPAGLIYSVISSH